ncbi:MAG: (2Fe-2S)-binding protein [Chloroflexi bacterium]|nr:(2Fe-2S)-binding protein [Chloroflexota bacterium]
MTDLITLTIDDKTLQVPKGTLIVDAAKRVENDIPVFCYHPKLPQVGISPQTAASGHVPHVFGGSGSRAT